MNSPGLGVEASAAPLSPIYYWVATSVVYWRVACRSQSSERLQKRREVGSLGIGEHEAEVNFVVPYHVLDRRGEAVVKYGARAASARSVGVLKRPRSAQSPVAFPPPASVSCRVSPVVLLRNVYSGRSAVRTAAEAVRMSKRRWLMLVPSFAEL